MIGIIVSGVLLAGVGIAIQMTLTAIAAKQLGLLQSVFIVNLTGTLSTFLLLIICRLPLPSTWNRLPWYVFLAGPLGIGIMAMIALAIPRIGTASSLVLSITAQLIVGCMLDHFGLLHLELRSIDILRLLGMVLVGLGAWLIAR